MGLKIKRGDTVVVTSGKEKGKRGEVERVLPRENRVVVGGVNIRTRHAQPTQNNQQGLYTFAAPIHVSNVMLVDPNSGEPTKVGYRFTDSGEKAQLRRARKSIAGFKIREGMPVGARVTLRGERMWEFLDRLISVALPRVRDFRGVSPNSFDGRGNYALGLREQLIFPEISYDAIDATRGLDVAVVTTTESDEEARELLRLLGMPFRES